MRIQRYANGGVKLSTQLDQLRKEHNQESDTTNTMPFHHQNSVPLVMMMRPDEEYGANYSQSNKPVVKILRRPTQHNSNDTKLNESRPKQPIKTLQQREQEYAEARLRILGSAKNPEDELESNLSTKIVLNSPSEISPTNYYQTRTNTAIASSSAISSTAAAAATATNDMNTAATPLSFLSYNMTNGQIKPQDNMIVRMPRGPDGTSGFNFRR